MGEQHQLPILRLRSASGKETVHYPLIYDGCPEEFKRMSERELHETEEKKKAGIEELRKVIEKEHMPRLDENTLVAILRASKYNLKKSKTKLKTFVARRQEILDLLVELDMKKVEKILDDMPIGFLPYRDQNGVSIAYTRPGGLNLDFYDTDEVATVFLSLAFLMSSHPMSSVAGFTYIGECKISTFALLYPIINTIRRFLGHVIALPTRALKLEIANENNFIRWFVRIISPFIPEKIYKRIDFHGDSYDKLNEQYHPSILPDVFDGTMGPLTNKHYKHIALDYITELKAERIQDLSRP